VGSNPTLSAESALKNAPPPPTAETRRRLLGTTLLAAIGLVHCGGSEVGDAPSGSTPDWYGKCRTDADCEPFGGGSCTGGTCLSHPGAPDGCGAPSPSTSEEALGAIECRFDIPEGARLVFLRSSANGTMGASGRSSAWSFVFDDPPNTRTLSYSVSDVGAVADEPQPDSSICSATIVPLPSSIVVPDATARVFARSSYDFVNVFVDQRSDDCSGAPPPRYVTVLGSNRGSTMYGGKRWFSYYDSRDAFERLCGPCDSGTADADCTQCSP
jgi:hypothetical protein